MTSAVQVGNPATGPRRLPWLSLGGGGLTVVLWGVHMAIRDNHAPGDPSRLVATTLLVIAFGLFVAGQAQLARALDEFQQRLQLVALSIAFPVSLVAAFAVSFFAGEGVLRGLDPRDLPAVMLLAYAVGLITAWRRYR